VRDRADVPLEFLAPPEVMGGQPLEVGPEARGDSLRQREQEPILAAEAVPAHRHVRVSAGADLAD
jgi:hypothetical protein